MFYPRLSFLYIKCLSLNYSIHNLNFLRQPASAKWYDRRDSVFIEFLVEDSKDVKVNFEKSKFGFRYVVVISTSMYINKSFLSSLL